MNTLEAIRTRHCYRGAYLPEAVSREDLTVIMQAGLDAPSGCNTQTTSLIAVDDPEMLEKVHEAMDHKVGESAPAIIFVLTQRIPCYHGMAFAEQDYSAAIENIMLAATELGYASCWYEGYLTNEEQLGKKVAAVLGIPDDYEIVCALPIGKPEKEVRGPKKKAFEERAWFNGFRA